ncbi:serine phosphatase RsbU (regulator of sigma subunit)/PAS domain-containing protein [Geodermatophilus bullaregiensis]|uniref:SpoIIE family protein phosphatase n=1 Tax=Geodermatophilus bullaregiensis TaxID=1564160 RepID=UPI0027DBB2B6|nr:SpoIIE family protein phosphatase [Geodermatophilus bullaregiensis]MBM7806983.1 serine phosphatase RsbU (regulator of sigma subunit)/PAS domain-containing protein [Geodermatophilus bullaregiensis]
MDGTPATLRSGLAMEAAGIGAFDWDLVTGVLEWDERCLALFGHDRTTFDGTIDGFLCRLHPDDRDDVAAAIRHALETCGELSALYRVCLPAGTTRWIAARGRALCDVGGVATRLLGAVYDVTDERADDLGVARVLDAMPAGFYSLDPQWRFTHVNAEAERLLGRSRDDLLGQVIWDAFPAAVNSLFEESYRRAVATGRPISFDAHYPAPLDGWYELRAWPTADGLSVYFLEVTDRVRAQEEVRRAAERQATVARISTELAGSMDAEVATGQVPRVAVPLLADACIVSVLDEHGRASAASTWHADETARGLLDRYARARLAALPSLPPAARAITTGEAVQLTGAEALAATPAGEPRRMLAQLAPSAALALPLRGRGRTLGLMSLFYTGGRVPTADEVATLSDVADRVGTALDNARLYGTQRQLALELQRSMLTAPPEPDHAEIVVRYLPAAEGAAVGGDWYDAFLQAGGATTLVIGDVVGHDSAAAATMGQLRSLLRGIAIGTGAGPAAVLGDLDRAMALLQFGSLATAAVARFEQTPEEISSGTTRMRWSNAGHPPPMLIGPDGAVSVLRGSRADLLLGVDPTAPRREWVAVLERGATVLLYTDGLVERRDSDLDDGQARLSAALAEFSGRPLQELCDLVVERMVDGHPTDDVALVAVRLHRQDRPRPASAGRSQVPDVVPPDPAAPTWPPA